VTTRTARSRLMDTSEHSTRHPRLSSKVRLLPGAHRGARGVAHADLDTGGRRRTRGVREDGAAHEEAVAVRAGLALRAGRRVLLPAKLCAPLRVDGPSCETNAPAPVNALGSGGDPLDPPSLPESAPPPSAPPVLGPPAAARRVRGRIGCGLARGRRRRIRRARTVSVRELGHARECRRRTTWSTSRTPALRRRREQPRRGTRVLRNGGAYMTEPSRKNVLHGPMDCPVTDQNECPPALCPLPAADPNGCAHVYTCNGTTVP
jgi:hypothetical protein